MTGNKINLRAYEFNYLQDYTNATIFVESFMTDLGSGENKNQIRTNYQSQNGKINISAYPPSEELANKIKSPELPWGTILIISKGERINFLEKKLSEFGGKLQESFEI